jgi:signal transduction histidine kinase
MGDTITADAFRCRSISTPGVPLGWRMLRARLLVPSTWSVGTTLLVGICLVLGGCEARQSADSAGRPRIEFTSVPLASAGNAEKLVTIKGRVTGAYPGQQVVLYAKDGTAWWVQPFANEPFTRIQPNSRWSNSTHPGTDYAALLVGADFQPPPTAAVLPTAGVVAFTVTRGERVFWQRWWFALICVIAAALAIFGVHRLRLHQATRQLSLRFEERLAERTSVAQELHDTLLQGVIAASMQLQVAVDQVSTDSPAQPALNRVLQLMGQVVEEGRNTVRGLRSSIGSVHDLEQSFSKIPQELNPQQEIGFRVIVEGRAVPLRPLIRNDVYGIGREALVNAFRHSGASSIEVELEYAAHQLRVLVRDNGCGINPEVLRSERGGHWGLSGMRERAERIGAKLKVSSSAASGTEVELRVPGRLAFESLPANRTLKWLTRLYVRDKESSEPELRSGQSK